MEAVLPVEIEIPSLRVLSQVKLSDAEWKQQRLEQLNMIDEKRLKALCHGQCYQQRITRSFNRKVLPHYCSIVLAEEITESDEGALKYLKDIKRCRIDDPKGFKLEFLFDTNLYFKNSVLTKIYHMIDKDEPIMEKAIGTKIEWYLGRCLTQKLLKKKLSEKPKHGIAQEVFQEDSDGGKEDW
ncbi:nucleosome assembly protein 1;2-like [Syzygium oleosum]|uniref:nucleosome assembly protein 1;2-like n=1 Tax=Syzygium oleosum TaxID=219896 RepID=UPI0011D21330|nr:nucleosome assembly protein 1;2-like [Syzygium oleosum]